MKFLCLSELSKCNNSSAVTNSTGSADRLNNFYARFDKEDHSEEIESRKSHLLELANLEDPIEISELEVIDCLRNINVKKAAGPDKISAKIIKYCRSSLLSIIHKLFNMSASLLRMPSLWKVGEIIPVSKKPIPKVDNDLRPVTLTAILSKSLERIMLPKIFEPVKPYLDPLQFAYLPDRCTEDALNLFLHNITQHLDKPADRYSPHGYYARCLFIDYSSAFNTMVPHILLDKLDQYNVSARLQLWILDFLTQRRQYVKTSSEISSCLSINTGAPQGCVLSAFLFILYTNDMQCNTNDCQILKYADDTIILGLIRNDDESVYRNTIEYVTNWCSLNCLELNVAKTKEMVFDFRKSNMNNKSPVIIHDSHVTTADEYKYLGVTVQSDLKWNMHVKNQVKKANKRMYHVNCLHRIHVDPTLICMFFNSIVMSVLSYAMSSWYNSSCDYLKKDLNRFAKRMYRIIPAEHHHMIVPLSDLFEKKCKYMCDKIMSDSTHSLHHYFNVLCHSQKLRVIYCRTNRFKYSFVPSSISVYNHM